mgnify:CR=1 FL=1
MTDASAGAGGRSDAGPAGAGTDDKVAFSSFTWGELLGEGSFARVSG